MRYSPRGASAQQTGRIKLFKLIKKLSAAGEKRLPGLRELSNELGISFATAVKVVDRMIMEGQLQALPRKGTFIVEKPQLGQSVTIIMGRNADQTYVLQSKTLGALLSTLDCDHVRIYQAADPSRAAKLLLECDTTLGIWYFPEECAMKKLNAVMEKLPVASFAISSMWRNLRPEQLPKNHVALDNIGNARAVAKFLLKLGYRKIARFNLTPRNDGGETPGDEVFAKELEAAGAEHRADWGVMQNEEQRIPQLLARNEITAAFVHGGAMNLRKALAAVASSARPEACALLVDHVGRETAKILDEFENLNIVGVNEPPARKLGVAAGTAANELLRGESPAMPVRIRLETLSRNEFLRRVDENT